MSDPDMKKKADHIWKMLDEMNAKDPGEYEKFVQKTSEEGREEMKREREREKDERGIQSEPVFCVRLKPTKLLSKT